MHEDLINQITYLMHRIVDGKESFSNLDMVHNVLPILRNMELVLEQQKAEEIKTLAEQIEGSVFGPLPPAIVDDKRLGPLYDRLSMHMYAYKNAHRIVAAEAGQLFHHAQSTPEQIADDRIMELANSVLTSDPIEWQLRFARLIIEKTQGKS